MKGSAICGAFFFICTFIGFSVILIRNKIRFIMKKLVSLIVVLFVLTQILFAQSGWKEELTRQIPALGHRNWILVADAAYPMQIKPGIQTIVTGEDQLDVVKEVLKQIKNAPHISAEIFMDREIDFVPENEVSEIKKYKKDLDKLLKNENVTKMLHEQLINEVDVAGQNFKVLVLKTKLTVPYTSVFIRLDCAYWNADQEQQMRESMKE